MIFNSFTKKLPQLRHDIDLIPVDHEGNELIYFHDPMGYIPENFVLNREIEPFLGLFNHYLTIEELARTDYFNSDKAEFLALVQFLDQNHVLFSNHFKLFREKTESEYEEAGIRNPWLMGKSYPAEADKMADFLNSLFVHAADDKALVHETPKALYAPHIDLSVGGHLYGKVFSYLKDIRPERVVILGTSHYAGSFHPLYEHQPFIGTTKDYHLPGREFKTDREYIDRLSRSLQNGGFTTQDRAHRMEHSLETHLLFLNIIWKHPFSVVPILVAGLEEIFYHPGGEQMDQIDRFADQLRENDDESTFYLISGDLSHVGKRFGDPTPASKMRASVEVIDRKFLEYAANSDAAGLLKLLSADHDATRICGFPPLYPFLKTSIPLQGKQIGYEWWDDAAHESAVSYGSVLYF